MRVTSTTCAMPRVTRASAQARTAAPRPTGRPSSSRRPDPASSSRTCSERTPDQEQGQGSGQGSGQDQVPGEEKPRTVKDYLMKVFQMLVQQVMDDANEELEKLEKRLKEHTQKMKELAREAPR